MAIKYLKKAIKTPSTDDSKTRTTVQNILNDIEKRREEGIKEITKKFDNYDGDIVLSKEKIEEAIKKVNQKTKEIISFGQDLELILKEGTSSEAQGTLGLKKLKIVFRNNTNTKQIIDMAVYLLPTTAIPSPPSSSS